MSLDFPEPNPGQTSTACPEHIKKATRPLWEALRFIQDEVKANPGLRVLAADDKRWRRVGWRLEYPDGTKSWVGSRLSDLREARQAFGYEAGRNLIALYLQKGMDPSEALAKVEDQSGREGLMASFVSENRARE